MQTLSKTEPQLLELKKRLTEIRDIEAASAVLYWDQATYMPPGGAAARGRQMATLQQIAHEKFVDPAIGQLLEDLQPYADSLPYDSFEASLVRIARRNYDRAVRVPSAFVAQFSLHRAESYNVWAKARPENDFAAVRPYLEKTVELSREYANFFPGYEHIADPLINNTDYGMKANTLRELFGQLRSHLVPIVEAIAANPPADDACLRQHFPEAQQVDFGLEVLERLGYDFQRGRQDKTHHPFTTSFSIGDVRITTRYDEYNLNEGLSSTIHEMGHALYELGFDPQLEGTPLADGVSSGVHESQSRLWENLVGRSREFCTYFYPRLQALFPSQLADVSLDTFYRALNKVQRDLIRTEADEVTYNLHVTLRFDLELALLEGQLAVRDLPEAWNARYRADLGIVPDSDRVGCLQDVHWYTGVVGGMFQGYTLGNLMSVQFYQAAIASNPNIAESLRQGEFGPLHEWLKHNIYALGCKYTAAELVERVTGKPLSIDPFMGYIRQKYGQLYTL